MLASKLIAQFTWRPLNTTIFEKHYISIPLFMCIWAVLNEILPTHKNIFLVTTTSHTQESNTLFVLFFFNFQEYNFNSVSNDSEKSKHIYFSNFFLSQVYLSHSQDNSNLVKPVVYTKIFRFPKIQTKN